MPEFVTGTFGLYVALGIFAQLVDGALGMAYGLIVTSTLLAVGWPPAIASASVHAAEVVTTGLAGASHVWHKNVDWKLFVRLAPAGIIGGAIGAYILVGLPEGWVKVFVSVYLLTLTAIITRRVLTEPRKTRHRRPGKEVQVIPIGAVGGFLDAIGGGGWGPIVTSTLIVRGDHPRQSIGSATLSEFLVTIVVSATFIATLDFMRYWQIALALIIGGAMAAPFAGWLSRIIPVRWLMIMVAIIIAVLSVANITMLFLGKSD